MTEKYAWQDKGVDEAAAKELFLYIDSDSDLYRQQHFPIIKNLVAKKARGTYNSALAAKGFGYLVESGAKKYYAENVEGRKVIGAFAQKVGRGWSEMFPKKLRDTVAEELRDHFEVEHELGNYSLFLPAKYQTAKKPTAKRKTTKRTSKKLPPGYGIIGMR